MFTLIIKLIIVNCTIMSFMIKVNKMDINKTVCDGICFKYYKLYNADFYNYDHTKSKFFLSLFSDISIWTSLYF